MNIRSFLAACALVAFGTAGVAQTWTWQHPTPQGNAINDVVFVNTTTGYIVGDYGTIIRTTDGGVTWGALQSNTTNALYCVSVAPNDVKYIMAAGANNTLDVSTDAGTTWTPTSISFNGVPSALMNWRGIAFRDSKSNIYVCGDSGYIAATNDGAQTWNLQRTPSSLGGNRTLEDIVFWDNQKYGVAVGDDSTIVRTTNSGSSWTPWAPSAGFGNGYHFRACAVPHGVTTTDCYAAGNNASGVGIIVKSTDWGATWTYLNGPGNQITDIRLVKGSPNNVFATTTDGTLLSSTNGGLTWGPEAGFSSTNVTTVLSACYSPDPTFICVIAQVGRIFIRDLNAPTRATWVERSNGFLFSLYDVDFIDAANGAAAGDNGAVSMTTNGGTKWIDDTIPGAGQLTSVAMAAARVTYVAGAAGKVYRTTDLGGTWATIQSPTSVAVNCLKAFDDTLLWAGSAKGEVMRTTDHGANWVLTQLPLFQGVVRLCALNPTFMWALAQKDSIFATRDGGATWTGQRISPTGQSASFYDVCFSDIQDGWVSGNGVLYRTTDGGKTWNSVTNFSPKPNGAALDAVAFVDAVHGWTCGLRGLMYYTTDGGASWATQPSGTNLELLGIRMLNQGAGWAVGFNGAILKYGAIGPAFVMPTVVDFGTVPFGSSKDTAVFLRNVGGSDGNIASVQVTELDGTGITQFAHQSPVPPYTVPRLSGDSVHIVFSPLLAGANDPTRARMALMKMTGVSNDGSPSVTLVGRGAKAHISTVNSFDHNYGNVYLGHCATYGFVLKNDGELTADVSGVVTLTSGSPGVWNVHPSHVVIPVGGIDTIYVDYCPTAPAGLTGADSARLTITGVPNSISGRLWGRGVEVKLKLIPSGQCVELGGISGYADYTVKIQNVGNVDGTIDSYVTNPNPTQYSLQVPRGSWRPGQVLKRNTNMDSFTVRINVFKSSPHACDSTYIVLKNQYGDPLDSVCFHWCYNIQALCDALIQFDTLSCTPVGTCDSQLVTIRNCGDTVHLRNLYITGSKAYAFHLNWVRPPVPTFPIVISPTDSLLLWYVFCPDSAGDFQDANILADYGTSPDYITNAPGACGKMQGFIPIVPECVDFGTHQYPTDLPVVEKDVCKFYDYGATSDTLIYRLLHNSAAFVLSPPSPVAVQSRDTGKITITFNPPGPGIYSDTVEFRDAQTGQRTYVCLNGSAFTTGINWSPADRVFDTLLVGTTQCDTGFITNTGTSPVTLTALNPSGATTQFTVVPLRALPVTLNPGDTLWISFCYVPTQVGHHGLTVDVVNSLGSTVRFTRHGNAYVRGQAVVHLDVPPSVQLGQLDNCSLVLHAVLASNIDATNSSSFRGRITWDATRLLLCDIGAAELTQGYNFSTTAQSTGWAEFVASGTPIKGTGNLVTFTFKPYYGSARTTDVCLDSVFQFNVLGGDPTNPIVTVSPLCSTIAFDSVCGLNISNIHFNAGTFLYQNTPNPAQKIAEIQYQLRDDLPVTIRLVNTFGVEVMRPVDGVMTKGFHVAAIDVSSLPQGVYFYDLTAGGERQVRRLVVVK